MPRRCTVCVHPKRKEIDRAFIAGRTYRTITDRFGVTRQATIRHVTHVARDLWRDKRGIDRAAVESIAKTAAKALAAAQRLLRSAETAKEHKGWAAAITAMQRHVELMAKIEGRINDTQVVFILDSPAWRTVEDRIFAALEAHPKAKNDVARELMRLSDGRGTP